MFGGFLFRSKSYCPNLLFCLLLLKVQLLAYQG